jgi:hypothetical protein
MSQFPFGSDKTVQSLSPLSTGQDLAIVGCDPLENGIGREPEKALVPPEAIFSLGVDAASRKAEILDVVDGWSAFFRRGASLKLSLSIQIPLFHNPDANGIRDPVEREQIERTEAEMEHLMGYHRSVVRCVIDKGWYRDKDGTSTDELIQYTIIFTPDDDMLNFLVGWEQTLKSRFQQRSIFMAFAPIITW